MHISMITIITSNMHDLNVSVLGSVFVLFCGG